MRRIATVVVLIVIMLVGGAISPVAAATQRAPVMRTCTICRFIDLNALVFFLECRLPADTPMVGWESIGRCTYLQSTPGMPMPQLMKPDRL